jgi:hypothetical protein
LGLQTKLLHFRGITRAGNYSCQGVGRIGTSKGEGLRYDRGPGSGWEEGGRKEGGSRPSRWTQSEFLKVIFLGMDVVDSFLDPVSLNC